MPLATAADLTDIALFDVLEPDALTAIAPWFELREVSAGTTLTAENAPGYSFFVIRTGTATVTIDDIELRTLEQGDFFGELAILGEGRRTATVRADSPMQLLVLFGTEFRRLQQEYPDLAVQIESRLRQAAPAA